MGPWLGIVSEANDDFTFYLLSALLFTSVVVHAAAKDERRRLLGIYFLFAAHLALVPVAGVLRAQGSLAYQHVRLACMIFGVMTAVSLGGTVLFGTLLPRVRLAVPRILSDVIMAASSIVAVFALASRAGYNLSGLIATSAVLTAVVGFSLQDTLGNVMGGLALQLDKSVKVGDWIKVGDVAGRVTEIRWRYTAIETRNWETYIIPNSTIMKGQVLILGRKHGQPPKWRRWIYFNVDFRYQPSDVIEAVNSAIRSQSLPEVARDPVPNCILMDLGESYARYAARYWLTDLALDDGTDSIMRTRIYFALKRAGIPLSIPAQSLFVTEDTTQRKAEKSRAEHDRRLGALAKVELFSHLSDEDRERLADSLRFAPFTRGEVLTRQGAEAHWLYMIIHGEVCVRIAIEGGHEREVAHLANGAFFGEMSLMTGERRSATVVAETDVECYRLDKAAFQEVVHARPELAEHVAEILARRRVELMVAKENLDLAARTQRLLVTKSDLLGKIRDIFGLTTPADPDGDPNAGDERRAVS